MSRILVVEDRDSLRNVWQRALSDAGHQVTPAATLGAALDALEEHSFDIVLTDLRLPDGDGTGVVERARHVSPEIPIVMMTAFGSVQHAVDAMKLGATDFLEKPVDVEALCQRIEEWSSPSSVPRKVSARALEGGLAIVGSHPRLAAALRLVDKVAPMESTVLLLGESGTGKELFARAIHEASPRKEGPFVAVNCAALPEALIENELFGHERGAFTGADRRQQGRFEAAEGGTLLLDEIGELPLGVQAKILRVLEEKTYERVGGRASQRANVRLIAATNRNLEDMVKDGRFRADLFYRLEVFPIDLPSLAERRSDIPALSRALLERVAVKNAVDCPTLSRAAEGFLERLDYPGNVRQLSNLLERALILGSSKELDVAQLEALLPSGGGTESAIDDGNCEEQQVRDALKESAGNKAAAAQALGVSLRTLQRRVQKYGLSGFPQYRS